MKTPAVRFGRPRADQRGGARAESGDDSDHKTNPRVGGKAGSLRLDRARMRPGRIEQEPV
jgi:hypothetical protein